jgi:protein-disulfide isomerase
LNKSEFQSCVSGNTYSSQVQQDIVQANQAGVTSTPSFIVNGKLVSMTDLQTTIETALAAASK